MKTIVDTGFKVPLDRDIETSESRAFFERLGEASLPDGEFRVGTCRVPRLDGRFAQPPSRLTETRMNFVLQAQSWNVMIQGTCERVKNYNPTCPDGVSVELFAGVNEVGKVGINAIGCISKVSGICRFTREQCDNAGAIPVLPLEEAFEKYY